MRAFVFLCGSLLLGCSSTSSTADGGGGDATADTGGGGDDAAGDAGPSAYCPAGATLVPFLSDTRVGTFPKAQMVLEQGKDYFAVLETDAGRLVLDLYEKNAPITVNSFVFLTLNHFYDGTAFHRVIEGFMAQGGDPNSISKPPNTWGTGGAGYTFGLELDMSLDFNARGVLGEARGQGPNTNGSQFFITLVPYPSLNQQYTVFGKVLEGDKTLDGIVRGEPPMNPTRVTEAHICQK